MVNSISVDYLVQKLKLDVYYGADFLANKQIEVSDISRPGLELTNYFNFYPKERIQLLGRKEITYSQDSLDKDTRLKIYRQMAADETPVFVISRGLTIPIELRQACEEKKIPILRSNTSTSQLLSNLTTFLEGRLAKRESIHGELLEIYGLGVLITGDSGIGKSEAALGLIQRGHRLIADDRLDIYRQDEETVIGEAPKILRNLLEIRGVGIIDVMNLFGVVSVKKRTTINFVVNLQNWDKESQFDRLGNGEERERFFDVDIPKVTIPVKVGRNIGDIIEAAAMNFRAKNMGYDATKKFNINLNDLINKNSNKN